MSFLIVVPVFSDDSSGWHDVASAYRCCVSIALNCTMWLLPLDAERALCNTTCVTLVCCVKTVQNRFFQNQFSQICFYLTVVPASFFTKPLFFLNRFFHNIFCPNSAFPKWIFSKIGYATTDRG